MMYLSDSFSWFLIILRDLSSLFLLEFWSVSFSYKRILSLSGKFFKVTVFVIFTKCLLKLLFICKMILVYLLLLSSVRKRTYLFRFQVFRKTWIHLNLKETSFYFKKKSFLQKTQQGYPLYPFISISSNVSGLRECRYISTHTHTHRPTPTSVCVFM